MSIGNQGNKWIAITVMMIMMMMSMAMTMTMMEDWKWIPGSINHSASLYAVAYSPQSTCTRRKSSSGINRRDWLAGTTTTMVITLAPTSSVHAKATPTLTNPLPELIEAQETLAKLLDNWKRATIDCTFADVPRELLEQKNKELLLEKASTFALFDKSVSVETCRTTNRIVRDYLGVTGKGPLVGMEKKLKRGLNYLDDADDLDAYVIGTYCKQQQK